MPLIIMTEASNDYLLRIYFNRVNIPSHLFKLAFPHRHLQFYENCQCEDYHKNVITIFYQSNIFDYNI